MPHPRPCLTKQQLRGITVRNIDELSARHDADSVFAWLRGRAHASPRSPSGDVRGRRSRVVLTPGVCASSPAVMPRPNRVRTSAICRAMGAIVHRSPGRARRTPLKPRPGDRHHLWSTPVCISTAHGPAGASRRPAFPAPLSFSRVHLEQNSGECAAGMRTLARYLKCELESNGLAACSVIARSPCDEAIQSPSAERSWIASLRSQ